MLAKFIKFAGLALGVAFIVSMAASYFIQTGNADSMTSDELNLLLDDVQALINDNDDELLRIRSEMDKEYIEKTRAFAEMIRLDPSILDDFDRLCKIRDNLGVDELHVTDENGVLLWGTVTDFYGFNFADGDQTRPLLAALDNPNYEYAQDPQMSGTGFYFQYISVARYDKKGIVQIGMRPERLEEALSQASEANMLDVIKLNLDMRLLIIDPNNKIIMGDSQNSLEGASSVDEVNITKEGEGFTELQGKSVFYVARMIDGKLAAAVVTQNGMYGARNQSLIIVAITNLIIFTILLIIIAMLVSKQFAEPLNAISATLEEIGKGNLDRRVSVYTSKEFNKLSDGINSMVENIKSMLAQSRNVNDMLKGVVGEIEINVGVVESTTEELFSESKNLSDGASEQSTAVSLITDVLQDVKKSSGHNAENAGSAYKVSLDALQNADEGSKKMVEMVKAVQDIDRASQDISKVIKTIDDIAFQTNILALNAAVEAARAGAAGKGFSVVAEEVRNLANKSADAAKQTAQLITSSISKAQSGVSIASETSEKISEVVEKINKSATMMEEISGSSQEMIKSVELLSEKIGTIIRNIEMTTSSALRVTDESEKLRLNANKMSELIHKFN